MDKKELFGNLKRLGFVLMEVNKDFDVNKTLAEVVKSKDTRLWEGFPVLLANAAQEYEFDYDQTLKNLTKNLDQENFRALLLLSLALYRHFYLSFHWSNQLKKYFSKEGLATLQELKNSLTRDDFVFAGDMRFHSDRLKATFNNYFEKDAKNNSPERKI